MDIEKVNSIKARYNIIGNDARLNRAIDTALQVARTDLSVLIQGESGVGKEVIPRIIHDHSTRKTKKYIAINCGSIPEGTIDSELFGHEKGAFTGAIGEHEGYFGAANGGTLFLDEVGELPLSTQARLLRVLETGEYIRVGSNQPRRTDVRIVAATNVNFQKAIREGKFREDLYFRLCTISIKVPPLRERGDDVIKLFKKFSMDVRERYSIPDILRLTPEAEQAMRTYTWPGNIRQLRNLAEQLNILHSHERLITLPMLAEYDVVPGSESMDIAPQGGEDRSWQSEYGNKLNILFAMVNKLAGDVATIKKLLSIPDSPASADPHGVQYGIPQFIDVKPVPTPSNPAVQTIQSVSPEVSHVPIERHSSHFDRDVFMEADDEAELVDVPGDLSLEKHERRLIEEALRRNRYRRKQAAHDLGISERTLYRKIKDYNIEEN